MVDENFFRQINSLGANLRQKYIQKTQNKDF